MKKIVQSALCAMLILGLNACANNGANSSVKSKATNAKTVVTEEDLGLRDENLYTEKDVVPVKADYTKPAPGMSKKFARSYENAPPLIPHSVDGLLPITRKNNACLGCHMPNVAKSMGATPIPKTHFMDFRSQKMLDHLAQQRFNCSQCHVPQANVKPLVKNNFKPEYRRADEKFKSHLISDLNEGVK